MKELALIGSESDGGSSRVRPRISDQDSGPNGSAAFDSTPLPPPQDRFMRLPEVLRCTGLSRSTLYDKVSKGHFPKQIPLGANIVAWRESEVLAWMRNPI